MCQTTFVVRRPRQYRRPWLWLPAIIGSATAQGAALVGYSITRPEPLPALTIELTGEGNGTVLITREGDAVPLVRCSQPSCSVEVPRGAVVHLVAIADTGATFGGYFPERMRPPLPLQPLLGDPLANCVTPGDITDVDAADIRDPNDCRMPIIANTHVLVDFGEIPKEVDVALLNAEPDPTAIAALPPVIKKPEKELLVKAQDVVPPPPPVEVALLPPPKPEVVTPPPQEKPNVEKLPTNMTMVEVPDKNEVKEAPDDATHLSDKNRDVNEETKAKDTNLEKELEGTQVASVESSDTTSPEIGGPDDKIAQVEETEATTDKRFTPTSDHSGDAKTAKGAVTGDGGDNGNEGAGETKVPGILSMRGIGGRGSLVDQKDGDGKKVGKKGLPGINSQLAFNDYERIVGKDRANEEAELARKKLAAKKGRYERKLEAMRSSLENFTPDVRPGNQTALKTRAHPFAVYLARMHRRIHELWGFGYLQDLDNNGSDSALNDFELWTNLEIAINPDGSIFKVTIVKASGKLEFDIAAIDTVQSSGPYEATPEAIRSVDGRVYMRWGFHRDWRQCGTFNVEPYILSDIPGGIVPLDAKPAPTPTTAPTKGKAVTPEGDSSGQSKTVATTVKDDKALFAANVWVSSFATAQVGKLLDYSLVPFVTGNAGDAGNAKTKSDLKDVYTELIVESGAMRSWNLYTGDEYAAKTGSAVKLAAGHLVLVVTTAKGSFAVILAKQPSGEYRATQIAR